jgi:hypothetical protein
VEIESSKPTSSVEIGGVDQVPLEVGSTSKPTSPVEIKKNYKEKQDQEEQIGEVSPSLSGLALLRDVARAYPPTENRERYLQILGPNPDVRLLRACRAEWLDRGYNRVSWVWLTEWYARGSIPGRNGQPKPKVTSNGEKIVADYGDWYLVEACNGDGTSPRYRTAEAFARETGRNLEEVKAGWN